MRLEIPLLVCSVLLAILIIAAPRLFAAADLQCAVGNAVTASLGDGVTMRTCLWEKEPNLVVRAGPLELDKNGILILKTQTNLEGKLHGDFTSWSDEGVVIVSGSYVEGLKEGPWIETDKNGNSDTIYYRNGVPVEP
ncbi:MAG: hypothetical protein OEV07_12120 [Gammaproteobacteria bacterium]|nr:hypothetical protein [Gammaproteobacteria bacterium]